MPESIPFFDIVVFAIIAIFLGLRLHSALGKRTGFEQKQPTKNHREQAAAARPAAANANAGGNKKPAQTDDAGDGGEDGEAAAEAAAPMGLSGKGIPAIKKADESFNEADFLKGAKAAYRAILKSFADGDMMALKPLLGYELQTGFADAIHARSAAGESLTIKLEKLESAKITDAELVEGLAIITVAFRSSQKRVLKSEDGKILEGDENTAEAFRDRWVFERDVASRDPNWLLVETQTDDG